MIKKKFKKVVEWENLDFIWMPTVFFFLVESLGIIFGFLDFMQGKNGLESFYHVQIGNMITILMIVTCFFIIKRNVYWIEIK